MPTISTITTFSLPAGQAVCFLIGGRGTATVDPTGRGSIYTIGAQESVLGPYAKTVNILVTPESAISYRIDTDGNMDDQTPPLDRALMLDPALGLQYGGAALTPSQAAQVLEALAPAMAVDDIKDGIQAAYTRSAAPPDFELDFTQILTLPAGVSCSALSISSRGAYVTSTASRIEIALATVLPSLTASAWSVEVEAELESFGSSGTSGNVIFEVGGTTNNRVLLQYGGFGSSNYVAWVNATTTPSLDIKSGNNPSTGVPKRITSTLSYSGTSLVYSTKNANAIPISSLSPVSGTLTLTLGGSKSLNGAVFGGWIKRVKVWQSAITTANVMAKTSSRYDGIACWGDSLTVGTGASSPSLAYTNRLALMLDKHVVNYGVGGNTSTQIRDRFIAAIGDNTRKYGHVIWAGRNNPTAATVLADVQAITSRLGHSRFVVLSVINKSDGTENSGSSAHTNILATNAALAAAYPNNYIDVRTRLVADSGGANDAPSPSITADGLHLNDAGYELIAGYVQPVAAAWF